MAKYRFCQHLDTSDCFNLIMCGAGRGSTLVQHVMISAIIHAIWSIWLERNNKYYNDRKKSVEFLIHSITSEAQLSFNLVLVKGSAAMEYLQTLSDVSHSLETEKSANYN